MAEKQQQKQSLLDQVVISQLKRVMGRPVNIKGVEYIETQEIYHSSIGIAQATGIAGNVSIPFFQNPVDLGTPAVVIPNGVLRYSVIDGKPKDGEIWKILAVGFGIRDNTTTTDVACIDTLLRGGLTYNITLGDDNNYLKEKPLNGAFVNPIFQGVYVANMMGMTGYAFNEFGPITGSGNALKVTVTNRGSAAVSFAHDTVLTCYVKLIITRPRQKD